MENIQAFMQTQEAKVTRAQRLLSIVTRIGAAEVAQEKEVMKKGLDILAEHLQILLQKIKDQQKLCGEDNQCIALLDEELYDLQGRQKVLGNINIIEHVKRAAEGLTTLQVIPVSNALLKILGREKSLAQLYKAATQYKAAA